MNINSKSIVEWLKEIRKQKGYTLEELGEHTGLTQPQLSRIENSVSSLTLFSLVRICSALNISFTSLFSEKLIATEGSIPTIYIQNQQEDFEYPVLNMGDVDNYVHFSIHRKKAKTLLSKWLKNYIKKYKNWNDGAIDTLLDEAIFLLGLPTNEREGTLFKNLCYPIDIQVSKLRKVYLSGGALLLQDLGAYIRNQRLNKNFSLRKLSRKVDLSHPGLINLETKMSDRTLFSDLVKLDCALNVEGELLALAWRASEMYLGTRRAYVDKRILPYTPNEVGWIERLIILLRIYQHFDLLEDAQAFITDLRKMAVPYLSE
jgi:transcriptional regulator with XRE-family HTH domain